MNYHKKCECCGQQLSAYTHNINHAMITAFVKLVKKYDSRLKPVNINQDLDLDHNQKCNLPKLQYFGLIKNCPEGWFPTDLGYSFYYGETTVLVPAATMGNDVLPDDHEAWATHKAKRVFRSIYNFGNYAYKKRPEYQAEKSNQVSLF